MGPLDLELIRLIEVSVIVFGGEKAARRSLYCVVLPGNKVVFVCTLELLRLDRNTASSLTFPHLSPVQAGENVFSFPLGKEKD